MTTLLAIWTRLRAWVIAAGAVLIAIASAWLYGRRQGKVAQQQADAYRDAQANARAAQQRADAQETRNEVEAEVSQLPPAPPQTVATADPSTAAGKLRDDGWVRD